MNRKIIGLRVDIGTFQHSVDKVIQYVKRIQSSVNAYLQQLNPTTVTEEAQRLAKNALHRAKIRVRGKSGLLVKGFFAKEYKTKEGKNIHLKHSWFTGKEPTFHRKSSTQLFELKGKRLYQILDTGRARYEIVNKANKASSQSPLRFFWHKMSKFVVYHWKGKRGGRKRFIVVNPTSGPVDFSRGSRFAEAVSIGVEKMITDKFEVIRNKFGATNVNI